MKSGSRLADNLQVLYSQTRDSRRLKPIITLYSRGTPAQTKKFDGCIEAAFWIGVEYTEGDLESVKVRQPSEPYDTVVANLLEFSAMLVKRQINLSIEFFEEPPPEESPGRGPPEEPPEESPEEPETPSSGSLRTVDYKAGLDDLKDQYDKRLLTKRQYEAKRDALLKKWKEDVEGELTR